MLRNTRRAFTVNERAGIRRETREPGRVAFAQTGDLNPHAVQMADESMVRNLDAQARAIWPQEAPFLARYRLRERASILDAGCGTGEISSRLALAFAQAEVLGVDIVDAHLELARSRYTPWRPGCASNIRASTSCASRTGASIWLFAGTCCMRFRTRKRS